MLHMPLYAANFFSTSLWSTYSRQITAVCWWYIRYLWLGCWLHNSIIWLLAVPADWVQLYTDEGCWHVSHVTTCDTFRGLLLDVGMFPGLWLARFGLYLLRGGIYNFMVNDWQLYKHEFNKRSIKFYLEINSDFSRLKSNENEFGTKYICSAKFCHL